MTTPIAITDQLLREWPLPMPAAGGKEERGRILVVAGSPQIPGAARLAAEAALRTGAGKLVIGTVTSVAGDLAMAVPEARVIGAAQTPDGGIATGSLHELREAAGSADAIVCGPGLQDEAASAALFAALRGDHGDTRWVLDAYAMGAVRDSFTGKARADRPVLVTPHTGEMAHLTGRDKSAVEADPAGAALAAARAWHAIVALKGPVTHVATPDGRLWRHDGGNTGLGVSGSGDVLAGLIGGLAARGAPLEQAAVWGVRLHAAAGERLAMRFGVLGYLAREIAPEVPALMDALGPRRGTRIGFG